MIVLIDNYDSFSYNLYQLIGAREPDIRVIRNDQYTVAQIATMQPQAIILSPGPGRPEDAGVCIEAARELGKTIPTLGVCLGHQSICKAFGGEVSYAKQLMHGKTSHITLDTTSRLFRGMKPVIPVARYHSLSAVRDTLPEVLRVTAASDDGEIMALEHREYPLFGVQFHPESVLTPDSDAIIKNFLEVCHHD